LLESRGRPQGARDDAVGQLGRGFGILTFDFRRCVDPDPALLYPTGNTAALPAGRSRFEAFMRPDDLEQLKEELRNYHADLESPELRAELVEACWPRLLATLEIIPDSAREGDFLELGATPFFLTLCLRRLCSGRITLANWFGTGETHGNQRLTHARTGETLFLEYDLFNVETDLFPYADESFDVVIFSELIEHLGVNPVRALSEIHRVMRPAGHMILTTPNSISLDRLETYLRGGSQMVDRYSPLFGPGARHNREYHPRELRQLLDGNGFVIEELVVRDLVRHPPRERMRRAWWKLMVAWETLDELHDAGGLRAQLTRLLIAWDLLDDNDGALRRLRRRWTQPYWDRVLVAAKDLPREEHIFLRARRAGRFGWHFPPALFDNIEFYILVRHPWMEMGVNDTIQCGEGWYPRETKEEKIARRVRGVAQGFLKSPAGPLTFHLELFAPPGAGALNVQVIVWDRWLGRPKLENVYVDAVVSLERGRWQQLDLPLGRHPQAGDEVEVRIAVNGDARANPPLAEPGEDERGVAVHRFWLSEASPSGV
jgi:SAM-dependent methyltransferase